MGACPLMTYPFMLAAALAVSGEPYEPQRVGVFINEVMYHPHERMGGPEDFQWIELYNARGEIQTLTGWTLNGFTLPQCRIAPHGFLIVARQDLSDPDQDGLFYSAYYHSGNGFPHHQATIIDAEGHDFGLIQPHRVTLRLEDEGGGFQDEITYINSIGGDGDGPSLEKIVSFFDHNEIFWRPSKSPWIVGTPALQNSAVAVHMRVQKEREYYQQLEFLHLWTTLGNRSPYPAAGKLQTRTIDPEEDEAIVEPGIVFSLGPGEQQTFHQSWKIPEHAPSGDWLVKQVSFGQNQSLAPEIVEFTLGTVDVGSDASTVDQQAQR
ncbi:MAG: hypothetical protein CME06_12000 [Gemmatimonadetes bacterium]|nr:hypothetical protein [Gemmatimonadota bacterium]